MNYLWLALRNIRKIDSDPSFYETFEVYKDGSRIKRLIVSMYESLETLPWLKHFITMGFGFLSAIRFDVFGKGDRIITQVTQNERKQVEKVFPEYKNSSFLKFKSSIPSIFYHWYYINCFKWWRTIYSLLKSMPQNNTLMLLRSSELIFLYLIWDHKLSRWNINDIIIGTVSSPYALVFEALAQKHNINLHLIDHGYYYNSIPTIKLKSALFTCPLSYKRFNQTSTVQKAFFQNYHFEGISFANEPTIGILLPKIYDQAYFESIQSDFFIKSHPLDLMGHDYKTDLSQFISRTDIGVSGSSTVLVDVLLAGKPAVYVKRIDKLVQEGYEFVKAGIIPEVEGIQDIDPKKLKEFYSDPEVIRKIKEFFVSDSEENTEKFCKQFND